MKTTILLLLLSFSGIAQLTITGANEYPLINGTYSVSTYSYSNYWATIGSQDVGTFVYSHPGPSGSYIGFKIVRKQNHWYIEQEGDGYVRLLYKSVSPSTSVVPDCNTQWEVWTGMWYDYGIVPINTGNTANLILTGSCVCENMVSTTVNPSNIQLAILDSSTLANLPTAHKGMITYSTHSNSLAAYNGGTWHDVLLNRDNDLIGKTSFNESILIKNNKLLIFGNNFVGRNPRVYRNPSNEFVIDFSSNKDFAINQNGHVKIGFQANANSLFSVGGSFALPITTTSNNARMGLYQNTIIFNGATAAIVGIDDPAICKGRHLYIINHGSANITCNKNIILSYNNSTTIIFPGENFHIVSDGTDWHKIN